MYEPTNPTIMNYSIDIEITDTSLEDIGVTQENTYTPLYFDGTLLAGFWLDPENEFIKFYLKHVTSGAFVCKLTEENLFLLKKIHQDNNQTK